MYMAYSTNPQLPHVRVEAVRLVRSGWSTVKVARHMGYSQSAIVKWLQRAPADLRRIIPTQSSKPYSHPAELSPELVRTILDYRRRYRRCAFFIHHMLMKDGYEVSLSSVKRTLRRNHMSRFSKWKKWHTYPPRPLPERPGILVEADTIHVGASGDQLYIYTLLDVCSRWAYAVPSERITTHRSLRFVERAMSKVPFPFHTLQTDHGSEFSKWFTKRLGERNIAHRHSRIRTPNDNAHLERFNRTIQDECIRRIPSNIVVWRKEIPEYLHYYNMQRPHMGLEMKRPIDIIKTIPSY